MKADHDAGEGPSGPAPGRSGDEAADVPGDSPRVLRPWRHWRRSRPFWGGLFVILGGAVIILSERAPLPLLVHIGVQGVAGYLLPVIQVLCGLLLWFNPAQRTFYSILAILLALGSWVTSNLGGFFVGMLLGLVGGSLAFAWEQRDPRPEPRRPVRPPRRPPSAGLSLILRDEESDPPTLPEPDPQAGPAPVRPRQDGTARGKLGDESAPLAIYRPTAFAAVAVALAVLGGPLPPTTPKLGSRGHAVPAQAPPVVTAVAKSRLTALSAVLTGLSFDGIATVRTAHGGVSMLKFSMDTLTLTGVALLADRPMQQALLISGSQASFSGNVVLYTTKLIGDENGAVHTFTAKRPPTTLPRDVTFTNFVTGKVYLASNSATATWSETSGPRGA